MVFMNEQVGGGDVLHQARHRGGHQGYRLHEQRRELLPWRGGARRRRPEVALDRVSLPLHPRR